MKKISTVGLPGSQGQAPDHHSLWVAARIPTRTEQDSMDAVVKKFPEPADRSDVRPSREEAEAAVGTLLRWIGEDPSREGLRETPARVVKAYEELFGGYNLQPGDVLGRTFEDVSGYEDMVLVRDIDFHSHCEHHMVPIIGKAHVAYLPDDRVLGLSKIARLVDIFGRRLQTQESMTAQIAAAIESMLRPKGVAVMLEAEHMCMAMRGIRSKGSTTVTTAFHGALREDRDLQERFLAMASRRP
ncbi:GTP cyclohydrolase I [Aurantimonas endophytica]|uniref:GTP cyclohydrolase 1 n=2 Tax=Aurantimonas endophytica TaxID=1522175 RepID=A0A7W6HA24_9HYPH|nr:GTP cyclohydrolase I [Aurantimonas endophytica]